jgi:predicted RNase H-like HicB family nuclease
MAYEATTRKVTHTFEVEVERNDDEEEDRRYQAYCGRLTGCRVYASSKSKALRKIRQAIDIWLELADRQFADDALSIEERMDSLLPD